MTEYQEIPILLTTTTNFTYSKLTKFRPIKSHELIYGQYFELDHV